MNELVKFWDNLGFLAGVDEQKKERLSKEYQKTADYLTAHETEVDDILFSIMFPIVRRIVSGTNNLVKIDIEEIIKLISDNKTKVSKICASDSVIDFEAELCFQVSEEYILKYSQNKFKDKNLKL